MRLVNALKELAECRTALALRSDELKTVTAERDALAEELELAKVEARMAQRSGDHLRRALERAHTLTGELTGRLEDQRKELEAARADAQDWKDAWWATARATAQRPTVQGD